jgi:serine/threonine-protein kinase
MLVRDPCPAPQRLRELLDGHLPEPEQRQLVRHLDACANCQQALEGLAANAASWSEAARLLTPEGDARAGAITAEEPRRDGAAAARALGADGETITLTFLGPPREAGHLGRLGHYEVLEVIGSGGFGIVLKAFDEVLHRVVAIKVMTPQLAAVASARKRFSREARAAAAVTHEHVVTIHAVEEANDPPYLVMQYVAGISLQERIDRTGPMQVKEILRIGMQAAQGLAAAHAQGLIHRDIKPANILLENGVERVKLTDFGLARMADDASVSQSGVIAGTPLYMAPEQARGEELDARADLFSLGSVLYAMCTGHPPFRAGSPLAVLRRVSEDTPRPVREVNPDVPEWLAVIVAKLHEKDPARRFQSAAEVADLLGRHLAHLQQPATVPAPARLPSAEPGGVAHWKVSAALAALFLVLASAGGLFVSPGTVG